MLRISKLADYAVLLLAHMAENPDQRHSTALLSQETRLPEPTITKVLKAVVKHGLLNSVRGAHGGYSFVMEPQDIRITDIITAIDGPIALTTCASEGAHECEYQNFCGVSPRWQIINRAVEETLEKITLTDMMRPIASRADARTHQPQKEFA